MNTAAQHKRLRDANETTTARAEVYALIAASTHKECVFVRRALTEVGVTTGGGGHFAVCTFLSEGLLAHLCCILFTVLIHIQCASRKRE